MTSKFNCDAESPWAFGTTSVKCGQGLATSAMFLRSSKVCCLIKFYVFIWKIFDMIKVYWGPASAFRRSGFEPRVGLPNVLEFQGQSLNLPLKMTVSLILEKHKNVLEKI